MRRRTNCHGDERGRTIELPTFLIDRTEVTVGQYSACVEAGACSAPNTRNDCNFGASGRRDHPVNCVDWEQARAYCAWAGKRLPTEAEWEKAARGVDGRRYPWGDEGPTPTRANLSGAHDGFSATSPVGRFLAGASPFGALDMLGNVSEWLDGLVRKRKESPGPRRVVAHPLARRTVVRSLGGPPIDPPVQPRAEVRLFASSLKAQRTWGWSSEAMWAW